MRRLLAISLALALAVSARAQTLSLGFPANSITQLAASSTLSVFPGLLYPQSNSIIGQDLATTVGSISTASPFGYPGNATSGGLLVVGPAIFNGGSLVGPWGQFSTLHRKLMNLAVTATSSLTILATGDSVGSIGIGDVAQTLIRSYGGGGVGFDWYRVNDETFYTVAVSGGAQIVVPPTPGTWTYSPTGFWMDTVTTGGTVTFPGTLSPPYADRLVVNYATEPTGGNGTFKVQTSTTSSTSGFTDEAGYTAVSSSASLPIGLGTLTISKPLGRYWVRVVSTDGNTHLVDRPLFLNTAGRVRFFIIGRGGTNLADQNTVAPGIMSGLLALLAPDYLSFQFKDDNSTWPTDLDNSLTTFGSTIPRVIFGTNADANSSTGLENTQSNVNKATNNAMSSAFAQQHGFDFFDQRALGSYATLTASGGMNDLTHAAPTFSRYVGALMETAWLSFPGATLNRNVHGDHVLLGSAVTFSSQYFNGVPLEAYKGGWLRSSTPNDYSTSTMSLGFRNRIEFQTITGSATLRLYDNSAMNLGDNAYGYDWVAPVIGFRKGITFDQPGTQILIYFGNSGNGSGLVQAGNSSLRLRSQANGTGSSEVQIQNETSANNWVTRLTLDGNSVRAGVPLRSPSYTVAGLPSASTSGAGATAFVTDSTTSYSAATIATTPTGGGSNGVPVMSIGGAWLIH